jgi:hypothetical protein
MIALRSLGLPTSATMRSRIGLSVNIAIGAGRPRGVGPRYSVGVRSEIRSGSEGMPWR